MNEKPKLHVHCFYCGAPIECSEEHLAYVRKAVVKEERSWREMCNECFEPLKCGWRRR